MHIHIEFQQSILPWIASLPIAYAFAAFGVVTTIIGFITCNAGAHKISTASWFLWLVGDIAEAGTYFAMTSEDALKSAVPIVFACGTFITCVLGLKRRRFEMPDWKDWTVVTIDLGISASWFHRFLTAVQANTTLVLTEFLSFVPLYRGILNGKEREYPMTWVWWTLGDLGFLLTILSLAHAPIERVFPSVQMIAHALVLICIAVRYRHESQLVRAP